MRDTPSAPDAVDGGVPLAIPIGPLENFIRPLTESRFQPVPRGLAFRVMVSAGAGACVALRHLTRSGAAV